MQELYNLRRWFAAGLSSCGGLRWRKKTYRKPQATANWSRRCGAAILSRDPLICYGPRTRPYPLGLASDFYERFGDRPATFLLAQMWSIKSEEAAEKIRQAAEFCRKRCARHELIFLSNTKRDVEMLGRTGERALLLNENIFVSEKIFRPIENAAIEFDAVYNASLNPLKRHELAAEIPRVAYITYYIGILGTKSDVQPRFDLLRYPPLGHQLINPVKNDLPVYLPPEAVNQAYSRSAVGLCLSPWEGAMRASMEYMLAGLPIVSTPSRGGRDHFFDPDYCLIAEPDPSAIREAVAALRTRAIPRDYIRARTLAKVTAEREQFLTLLNDILERHGAARRFGVEWPYSAGGKLIQWKTVAEHWADIDRPPL